MIPAAKQPKGFGGAYLKTNASSGKGLCITVWESQADMEAGEAAGGYYQEQIAKLGSLFARPPVVEHYELRLDSSPEG